MRLFNFSSHFHPNQVFDRDRAESAQSFRALVEAFFRAFDYCFLALLHAQFEVQGVTFCVCVKFVCIIACMGLMGHRAR